MNKETFDKACADYQETLSQAMIAVLGKKYGALKTVGLVHEDRAIILSVVLADGTEADVYQDIEEDEEVFGQKVFDIQDEFLRLLEPGESLMIMI